MKSCFCCFGRFYGVLNEWSFKSLRLFCIVVCCFGLCSIVSGCVKLVLFCRQWILARFGCSKLFQVVFVFCFFVVSVGVKLCYCVACLWLF